MLLVRGRTQRFIQALSTVLEAHNTAEIQLYLLFVPLGSYKQRRWVRTPALCRFSSPFLLLSGLGHVSAWQHRGAAPPLHMICCAQSPLQAAMIIARASLTAPDQSCVLLLGATGMEAASLSGDNTHHPA